MTGCEISDKNKSFDFFFLSSSHMTASYEKPPKQQINIQTEENARRETERL